MFLNVFLEAESNCLRGSCSEVLIRHTPSYSSIHDRDSAICVRDIGRAVRGNRTQAGLGIPPRLWCFAAIAMIFLAPAMLAAQATVMVSNHGELPDASVPGSSSGDSGQAPTALAVPATIFGTVLDTNGAVVQAARVELMTRTGTHMGIEKSDSRGEFSFAGLPAGEFKVAVSGPGWGTFVSPDIVLRAGEFHIVSQIVLPIAASATVRVSANPDEIAEEQLHIAEQQRVLGVFPNFYTSYDWNAPPMRSRQKFQLALRSLSDPMTLLGAGAVAAAEQANNNFAGYGQGVQGYSKRYGAAYADDFIGKMLSQAVLPTLFHQDPRYFYRGNGGAASRAFYALSAGVMTRSDNGRWEPNYSYILGSFAAGGISNLYYPAADRGLTLTAANGLVNIAEHSGTNLLREFLFKRFSNAARDKAGAP